MTTRLVLTIDWRTAAGGWPGGQRNSNRNPPREGVSAMKFGIPE